MPKLTKRNNKKRKRKQTKCKRGGGMMMSPCPGTIEHSKWLEDRSTYKGEDIGELSPEEFCAKKKRDEEIDLGTEVMDFLKKRNKVQTAIMNLTGLANTESNAPGEVDVRYTLTKVFLPDYFNSMSSEWQLSPLTDDDMQNLDNMKKKMVYILNWTGFLEGFPIDQGNKTTSRWGETTNKLVETKIKGNRNKMTIRAHCYSQLAYILYLASIDDAILKDKLFKSSLKMFIHNRIICVYGQSVIFGPDSHFKKLTEFEEAKKEALKNFNDEREKLKPSYYGEKNEEKWLREAMNDNDVTPKLLPTKKVDRLYYILSRPGYYGIPYEKLNNIRSRHIRAVKELAKLLKKKNKELNKARSELIGMDVTESMDDLFKRANISKTQLDEMARKEVTEDIENIEQEKNQINNIMSVWDIRKPSSQGTLSPTELKDAMEQPGVDDNPDKPQQQQRKVDDNQVEPQQGQRKDDDDDEPVERQQQQGEDNDGDDDLFGNLFTKGGRSKRRRRRHNKNHTKKGKKKQKKKTKRKSRHHKAKKTKKH